MEFGPFLLALAGAVEESTSLKGHPGGADAVVRYVESREGERSLAAAVLSTVPRVLLIGPPGAGKTTLLRAAAAKMARDKLAGRIKVPTPLFVSASRLPAFFSARGGVVDALAEYSRSLYGVDVPPKLIARALEGGDLALIVDGLDEIGLDWNRAIADLSDFFRHFPSIRAIISSRPAALTANFADFDIYSLPDLDLKQQRQLVLALQKEDPELTRRFIEALERYPQAGALARTPLMLDLMFNLFRHRGAFPTTPTTMLAETIELSLRRWDAKRIRRSLSFDALHTAIAAVAASMLWNNTVRITTTELSQIIESVSAPDSTREILDNLYGSELFFQEIGPESWGFVHLLFLEYFAAWFYRDNIAKLSTLLSRPGSDSVLEFAVTMTANPAPLVEAAVEHGHLILAARMTGMGRSRNRALQEYVAGAFRKSLDPEFLTLLSPGSSEVTVQPVAPIEQVESRQGEPKESSSATSPPTVHEGLLRLLDGVRDPDLDAQQRGRRFEEFSRAIFDTVFKVVQANRLTSRGEVDLLLELEPGGAYWSDFGNEALVECKNLAAKTKLPDVLTFITKVSQSRRRLGFLVSHAGFTRDALNSLQAQANNPNAAIVVPIAGDRIRQFLQTGEAPADFFKNVYRDATLPRRTGGATADGAPEE
jgi:hypothetical protein